MSVPRTSKPTAAAIRSLAANVRTLRERRGITQESAAEAAGVSYIYWRQLERGTAANPSLGVLVALAVALGVEPMELLRTRAAMPPRPPGRPRTRRK